jgi:hypothetical protein
MNYEIIIKLNNVLLTIWKTHLKYGWDKIYLTV